MRQQLYGVHKDQEHSKDECLRDIRPLSSRCLAAIVQREGYALCLGMAMVCMLLFPQTMLVCMPLVAGLFAVRRKACRRQHLPMRVPASWQKTDYGDVVAGGGWHKARGSFYLGNEMESNSELWIAREDVLTHMLVLGTTGAGKTETLVSLAFNYLARGSGLLYVDPKAAPKLAAQIYTMCRIMGRDDDFLLLSYMADKAAGKAAGAMAEARGTQTMRRRPHPRQSNTQNPFAVGTANELTQLLLALMPEEGAGNAIFSSNAQTLISGLLIVLVEMRDRGEIPLSIGIIRKYLMSLSEIDALARRTDLSDKSILALRAGLATVGWDMSRQLAQQPRNFAEQYGYARAYFGRALSLLVDNYGRIFRVTHGEIDAVDVITSRRIYVTLIPSVDKDPRELRHLGQICLSSIRNACAVGLGGLVQGRLSDVLGALPTDARSPFGVIVDEYAAIETPGFEILLTQGRGLGIAVTVASQDFAGIRRASEHAAEQIVSNCRCKCIMCQEDPRQTMDLVRSMAGEAWVYQNTGYAVPEGTGSPTYRDNMAVSVARIARVDYRDLQKQVEGQMTVFFRGELIRARAFYADPPLVPSQAVRLNCHLMLQAPSPAGLHKYTGTLALLTRWLQALGRGECGACVQPEHAVPALPGELAVIVWLWERLGLLPDMDMVHCSVAALLQAQVRRPGESFGESIGGSFGAGCATGANGVAGSGTPYGQTGQGGPAGQDGQAGQGTAGYGPQQPGRQEADPGAATGSTPDSLADDDAAAIWEPGPEDLLDMARGLTGAAGRELEHEARRRPHAAQRGGRSGQKGSA